MHLSTASTTTAPATTTFWSSGWARFRWSKSCPSLHQEAPIAIRA